ncbi:uncharacterized protein [Nicotiana sylvestris]|uniref:uncharacterized protein n=1 Tax=Nicotiana sylvestris TaxID=4096 RepID=UPI00388CD852
MSTIQNPPFTDVDEFLFRLQMWWYELGGDGQKWVIKYLGALTDIMKVKPRDDDLITALVTFWDPVHNVFRFSYFELTPTLEEIAGYSGFDGDLRNQNLIFPKASSVHRLFGLLNISNQIRKSNVVKGCCYFNFLYSRFGKPYGFEIHEKGLINKQNKDTWQIHRRFAFMVAFLGIMVFPNKERTIDIRIARVVQVLTTKEHHTLAPIILSDIYRALALCKSRAKFFEGCNILLQMWLTEHLQHHPKFMSYGPSKDNFIESYEERIKDYKSPEGTEKALDKAKEKIIQLNEEAKSSKECHVMRCEEEMAQFKREKDYWIHSEAQLHAQLEEMRSPTNDENDDEEIDFDKTQPDDDTPTSPVPDVNPTSDNPANPNDAPSYTLVTGPIFSRQPTKRMETSPV